MATAVAAGTLTPAQAARDTARLARLLTHASGSPPRDADEDAR